MVINSLDLELLAIKVISVMDGMGALERTLVIHIFHTSGYLVPYSMKELC